MPFLKKRRHQGEHRALLSYLQGKTGDLAAILSVNKICTPSAFFHVHRDVIMNLLRPVQTH